MLERKKPMENLREKNICPNCGATKMRNWEELDFEQKFLAERLSASAEFSRAERKRHRFCVKCWFEEIESKHQIS